MKTLKNHKILYDADCPMCGGYTKLFVRAGMMDSEGRIAYQHINKQSCPAVNWQRAVNEIALVDNETGKVEYGIKSLFKIIGHSFPVLRPLFSFQPFIWIMSKVYSFISYNRKVIIPGTNDNYHIQPSFRIDYRILYLLFTVLLASVILNEYAPLFSSIVPTGSKYRELIVCGGQVIFQGVIISLINNKQKWNYLGNMMTISFAGALLLLPMLIVSVYLSLPQLVYATYFMLIAGLMLLEHIRRTKLLGLDNKMTISWVLYRIIILVTIFYTN